MSSRRGGARGGIQGGKGFSPTASPAKPPGLNSEDGGDQGGKSQVAKKTRNSAKTEDLCKRDRAPSLSKAPSPKAAATSQCVANSAPRFVSLAAAAGYVDVSTRTLRRYISQGRLTGYRVGPRLLKIDLNELEALARPIPTTSDGSVR